MLLFIIIAALALIFMMYVKYTYRRDNQSTEKFLERESLANSTRKQPLDDISYITVPVDTLPFLEDASDEIAKYQQTIRELSDKKIANLSDMTNTDLKLKYGAANLPILTEYDNNYSLLTDTISKWGLALMESGHEEESVTVLEYGIKCNTDIRSNYLVLADYYASKGDVRKIRTLRTRALLLHTLIKDSIISRLDDLLSGLS